MGQSRRSSHHVQGDSLGVRMSDLSRSGGRGIRGLAGKIHEGLYWTDFRKLLADELFRRAVEAEAGKPENMAGLRECPSYYGDAWPMMWQRVKANYVALTEQQEDRSRENEMREALYRELAGLICEAFRMRGEDDRNRVLQWVKRRQIPEEAPNDEYIALRKCERVEDYTYAESFDAVILSRMPWIPGTYNVFRFLDGARTRYKKVFLYLWAVFGDEIRKDHVEVRAARKSDSRILSYLDTDAREAVLRFKAEDRNAKTSGTRIPIDPEYGLLLAEVRAEIAQRMSEEDLALQDFVADLHVPQIARDLLLREAHTEELVGRHESRFFSQRAQWLIDVCNQFIAGTLPWSDQVDERIRRQTREGALENWEILLEFADHAERWKGSSGSH